MSNSFGMEGPRNAALIVESVAPALKPLFEAIIKIATIELEYKLRETELRLISRLKELSDSFAQLDRNRVSDVEERERQYKGVMQVLELAKMSGEPQLMLEAMKVFRAYVEGAPSFTRDFVFAMEIIEKKIELFPDSGSNRVEAARSDPPFPAALRYI